MKSVLTIVTLGPGDPDYLNRKTMDEIRNAEALILRTGRHSLVPWLDRQGISYTALDHIYESALIPRSGISLNMFRILP